MSSTRISCWGLILGMSSLPLWAQSPPAAGSTESPPATVAEEKLGIERLLEIHGFGNAFFGDTDGNPYSEATEDGNYQRSNFALNLTSKPYERLAIHAQIDVQNEDDGTEVELDFAFGEIELGENLDLRVGRVKQPFGLYTEIFDVGTLRLFADLPQVIYGPVDFIAEGFQGLSLSGNRKLSGQWGLEYDVYAGGLSGLVDDGIAFVESPGETEEAGEEEESKLIEDETIRHLVGGRITFSSAFDALRLGLSAHSGEAEEDDTTIRRTVVGVHADYSLEPWTVRAELAQSDEAGELSTLSYYGETAYRFAGDWQVAARYESLKTELDEIESSSSLLEHKEWSVGLSRWVTPYLVLRVSVHDIDGNRLAHPEDRDDLREALESGTLDPETRLVQLSAHFTF
jgi:hypothetical protein